MARKQYDPDEAQRVGSLIRTLRKQAGMTLDDLVAAAGVSANYISRVENGRVRASDSWVAHVSLAIAECIADEARSANARAA